MVGCKLLTYRCICWEQCRNFAKQTLSRKNENEVNFRNKSHCYRNLFPWKTQNEFNKHVGEAIVFQKDGVFAVNKPYGVAIQSYEARNTNNSSSAPLLNSAVGECNFTVESSLPFLRKLLDEKDLSIVKSAERYSSGLVLLATSDKVKQRLKLEFESAKSSKDPYFTNLCVTTGCLTTPSIRESVGITRQEVEMKQFQPVILTSYSKTRLKAGVVKSAHVIANTVKCDHERKTSLLTISSTQLRWHFVRVFAAHKGVGILGDNLFASRVKSVFGKQVLVSPSNNAAYEPPVLDEVIQRKLLISQNEIVDIPAHLHFYQIHLKKRNVIIEAEPPEYFKWTCKQLDLMN